MFSSFSIPSLRSLLSKQVETWELGKFCSVSNKIENIKVFNFTE